MAHVLLGQLSLRQPGGEAGYEMEVEALAAEAVRLVQAPQMTQVGGVQPGLLPQLGTTCVTSSGPARLSTGRAWPLTDSCFSPASAVGGHVIMPDVACDLQERLIKATGDKHSKLDLLTDRTEVLPELWFDIASAYGE